MWYKNTRRNEWIDNIHYVSHYTLFAEIVWHGSQPIDVVIIVSSGETCATKHFYVT